jgi:hypothetical protein
LKKPKMSPYANRKSVVIHREEILSRTPTLASSRTLEPEVDTLLLLLSAPHGNPITLKTTILRGLRRKKDPVARAVSWPDPVRSPLQVTSCPSMDAHG